MALPKGAARFLLTGGIETKSDEKVVPATKLLVAENCVFGRHGAVRKRNGYTARSQTIDGSADTLTDAIRLACRGDELLAFTADHAYSNQPDADQWGDAGPVYSAIGSDRPLVKTGGQQTMCDQAELGGSRVVAWEDNGINWTVVDATSGRIHRAATLADADGISPRCVAVGANLHIYYAVPTQQRIMVIVVNPATPSAAVSPVILVSDLHPTRPVYDACPTTRTDSPALISWYLAGSSSYKVGYVTSGGVLGTPANGNPDPLTVAAGMSVTSPLACSFSTDTGFASGCVLGVAYITSGNVGTVANLSGGTTSEVIGAELADVWAAYAVATDVQRIALEFSDDGLNTSWVAFEEAAAEPSNRFCVVNSIVYQDGPATETAIRSVGLASRAFALDANAFAVFVHDTTFFNTYVTLRLSDFLPVGRHTPGSAAGAPTRKHLSSAAVDSDTVSVALSVRERLVSEEGDKFTETGIRLVTMDFDSEDSHQAVQLGAGLYLAGACPMHYDGRIWTEQGFHFGPELIATVNSGAGSLTDETTYKYIAWYESTDAQGEIHRGPTSIGTVVTLAAGEDEVTLTLPTLRVTGRTNVRICVARSLAAETGDTAQLFRVTSYDPSTIGDPNGYVANDKTVDTATFVDRMSDDTLRTQEPLYTNGGYLSTDPSALGSVIAVGKGRIFTTDPGDGNTVRYSQPISDGGYGAEFPPELFLTVDPFGGDVTALAVQDDSVIVWKERAIFSFSGDGPLQTGDTSTQGFAAPRLITSDVGCTDPASIVMTPLGHMFKSEKGIYLIDRSGSVSYVGAPVEAFNAQRITAATIMPDRTQIVFLTDAGTTLLFDYLFQQWSTFTNHLGRGAAVVSGVYHYLRTDGRVFREAVGSYSDAGTRITLRLETAWIHVAEALQGFQRFWNLNLLGTWISPHQLRIQSRTNYSPEWCDPVYLDATGESSSTGWITGEGANVIGEDPVTGSAYGDGLYGAGVYGGENPDIYQWRYHIGGRGQSVQFRFEDFERDGLTGASFELTEMLIEGGVAGTSYKPVRASRSA